MKMKTAYMMMALAAALAARAEYQYVFDTSGAPELAEWTATNLAPVVREWYPKLVEMFPSEGWTAPEKVSFRYREGLPHPAHTVKDEVTTLRSWYTDNPGDVGCAVHELFHVVQGGYRRAPGWLTEGIADYVRWYLFEPGSHGCDMDVKSGSCRYNGSYRVSANFLNRAIEKEQNEAEPDVAYLGSPRASPATSSMSFLQASRIAFGMDLPSSPKVCPLNAPGISNGARRRKCISSGEDGVRISETFPVKKASESAHVAYSVSTFSMTCALRQVSERFMPSSDSTRTSPNCAKMRSASGVNFLTPTRKGSSIPALRAEAIRRNIPQI